jgi:hypothetical protein
MEGSRKLLVRPLVIEQQIRHPLTHTHWTLHPKDDYGMLSPGDWIVRCLSVNTPSTTCRPNLGFQLHLSDTCDLVGNGKS